MTWSREFCIMRARRSYTGLLYRTSRIRLRTGEVGDYTADRYSLFSLVSAYGTN